MDDEAALLAMAHEITSDSAVYAVTQHEKTRAWRDVIDLLLTDGATLTSNSESSFYLIASYEGGKVVRMRDGRVVQTTPIVDWDPAQKTSFRKAVAGDHVYRKVLRVA